MHDRPEILYYYTKIRHISAMQKKWPVSGKMWLFQMESGYNLGMLGTWGWTSALCEVPKDA